MGLKLHNSESREKVVRSRVTLHTFNVEDLPDGQRVWLTCSQEVWEGFNGDEGDEGELTWDGYVSHDESISQVAFYQIYGRGFDSPAFCELVEQAREHLGMEA